MTWFRAFVLLAFGLFATVACGEMVMPSPTENYGATVTAMVREIPTQTAYPTLVALPTYTLAPTYIPFPTYSPLPTHSPLPTYSPLPSLSPLPTYTSVPEATPYPTYTAVPSVTPYPTYTPQPVPTASVVVRVERDGWLVIDNGGHYLLGDSGDWGPWIFMANCVESDVRAYLLRIGGIYIEVEDQRVSILAEYDDESGEEAWDYVSDDISDFLIGVWSENIVEKVLKSEKVVFRVPGDYTISFDVSGLDQYIENSSDLC